MKILVKGIAPKSHVATAICLNCKSVVEVDKNKRVALERSIYRVRHNRVNRSLLPLQYNIFLQSLGTP